MTRREQYMKIRKQKKADAIQKQKFNDLEDTIENLEQRGLITVNQDYKNLFKMFSTIEILKDIENNKLNFDENDHIIDPEIAKLYFHALIRYNAEYGKAYELTT